MLHFAGCLVITEEHEKLRKINEEFRYDNLRNFRITILYVFPRFYFKQLRC